MGNKTPRTGRFSRQLGYILLLLHTVTFFKLLKGYNYGD